MSSNSLTFSHSQRYTQIENKPSYFYIYLVGTMQHMKQKATTDTNPQFANSFMNISAQVRYL